MPQSGDPQTTDIHILPIPCDAALETTPVAKEVCLLACPDGNNMQLEILSVGFRANTLPVDATNVVTLDLEHIDDSDSDSVTTFATAYNMLAANATVLVYNEIWCGSRILDPGDVINAEFTTTDPDTASEGAALIVEYRILRHS